MEDSFEITSSSSSYTSSSARSNGILEIDMDRLPRYSPPRTAIASPAPSVGSCPCLSDGGSTRLSKLVTNVEKMLNDKEWDYSDADIIIDDVSVGVNRFVLASGCSFFHELFSKERPTGEGRPKFYMTDLVPNGKVEYEAFLLLLGYLYTGYLKSYPSEVSTCVDFSCIHDVCRPAIDFQLQLLYATATFQIEELVSSLQTDLLSVVEKALVEDVIPILVAAFDCKLNMLKDRCVKSVAQFDIKDLWLERELPHELQLEVRVFRGLQSGTATMEYYPSEKTVQRIYEALDTGDFDLLHLLLDGAGITLDKLYGLHYAAIYCDPKVVCQILKESDANVNLRNSRGYTVLHMAARRMDPSVLVSLCENGARASDCTLDGQDAVSICRRMTRPKEYRAATNKGRDCIGILERDMQRKYEFSFW